MRILMLVLLFIILFWTTPLCAEAKQSALAPQAPASAGTPPAANFTETQQKFKPTPSVFPADNSVTHPLLTHASPSSAEPASKIQDMNDILSRHMNFMTYGFAVLAVFAAVLALVGVIAPFLSVKVYRAEIKEKKI